MNGYGKIMLISTIIVIISIVIEFKKPLYPLKKDATSNIKRLFWRWLHWAVIIFMCFFFLFFDIKKYNDNIAIYYSFMTMTLLHWTIGNFCVVSLLETKHYDVEIEKITTNNIPHLKAIFKDNAKMISNLFYFFGGFNIIYITFLTKNMNPYIKYTLFSLFAISYLKNYIFAKESNYEKGLFFDCLMINPYI